jgi:hypothetical protein
MDKVSAFNLYRLDQLERCEISECEKDFFNIYILGSKINDAFLTPDDRSTPMKLAGRSYALQIARHIGFKPDEIEFIK